MAAGRRGSERLSSVDTAWLRMESPTNMAMVTGVLMFDEPVDFERLKATIKYRLLRFRRFRQRAVESHLPLGWPHWKIDPTFDLNSHLHRIALPAPGDQDALQDLASDLMSTPLDFSKPLWQMHYVENFGRGCALVVRLHHCIADGIALMHVLLSLADEDANAPWPEPEARAQPRGALERWAAALGATLDVTQTVLHEGMEILSHPSRAADLVQVGAGSAAALGKLLLIPPDHKTLFKGKTGVTKRAAWSAPIALGDVKRIGSATGGTVNDILLSAVTGGLRRYMRGRGEEVEGVNFRAIVPVNLRPPDAVPDMGNRFGLVFLSLPVGIEDPVDRLFELKQRMDAIKGSPEAAVAFGILAGIGMTPTEIERVIITIFGLKGTVVMTNVPGPHQAVYLAGKPLRGIMFWVPSPARLGLGVSILSYAGEVRVGVQTDAGLVPDPDTIVAGFHAELDELLELARAVEATGEGENAEAQAGAAGPRRCQALTRAGTRCKNPALPDTTFCRVHAGRQP